MIDQLFQEADTNIIPKWPPVNNYQIISDLIDLTSNKSSLDYVKQITDFFDQFTKEFLNKIDIIKKKTINEAQKYPIDTQQILKRYQEISNILQFKQLLNNEQSNNLQDHSNLCKEFISQMESQKDQNTELLQSLLTQANQLKTNFNMEYPHIIKQQLFNFIDHISFFNSDIPEVSSTNHNNTRNHLETNIINQSNQIVDLKLTSDLIMKLVSNKLNFCSDQFLNMLSESLQRINPLLKQFIFNTAVFKENKEQIDFSKISEEKINLIEEYVKHSIALSRGEQQYEQEVKDSLEIKQMTQIVDSKMSFLRQEFVQQFENFLVDVKPFLKQINFTNSFTDKNKFDFIRNINLKDNKLKALFQESLPNLDLQLFATQWKDGQRDSVINKKENGYYEIEKLNNNNFINCISNTNLQKDQKYIFRIKVESLNDSHPFMIGLMRNSNVDQNYGYYEYLSCYLQKDNQSVIKHKEKWGIDKQLKGAGFKTSGENMIELRLCLKEQILEVLDYPNYEILGIKFDIRLKKLLRISDLQRIVIQLRRIGRYTRRKEQKKVKIFTNYSNIHIFIQIILFVLHPCIKQQLFTFIDNISFFNSDIPEVGSTNHNNTRNHQETNIINQSNQIVDLKLTSDLIMKLVSNKSNFCSDQFLNKLSEILQRINPLLKQFTFNTAVFKENKEQIDFSKISEEKINLIEEYVKHSIALSRGEQQYEQEVKDSLEIKQMTQIVDSKMSFLKQEFIQQFEKFLVDVKPFLKQINFTNSFTDKNKFDYFRNINLKDKQLGVLFDEIQFISDLKLFGTQFKNGQRDIVVNKKENGYYEIEKLNNNDWVNCISNTNLQKDQKYIFRIKVESLNEGIYFMIGLMRNLNADLKVGYNDYLSCYLKKNNQSVIKHGGLGIDKQLKGAGFKTSGENMIELRLCLKEQILEVLDYPNYEYKLGLEDKYKEKLTQFDDLRFYLGLFNKGSKLILMDVKIVNEFVN
ncbi:hypothetical protein TTHERM_00966500 (macronuclear) [Tetrahymena thermophila SB210]|uniref:Zinc carboxypeptidase family protein n=1 Tax=Tetrahymena thermophila (strain SB210) TaxID=312017 RepID=Q22TR6_TETTS|nr:hypothetical protein TTHERM_00966500 [Tetrahymena thermophila SB210]EAR88695.2 hypothetical protein TTHERM_00966500 [Tetrahymena thermophila SB210]|eukprot:XP_001008940.2 hypothetical protein TTHERM_00966500 [Tetrahymena thermophila SB210]